MKEFDIEKIDRNMAVAEKVNAPDLKLFDVRKAPFRLYGLYDAQNQPQFKRMPDGVAEATENNSVRRLYTNTAGGRVRFATDSPYIVIKAECPRMARSARMSLMCTSGFDLYIDAPDGSESMFYRSFVPPAKSESGYESKIDFYTPGLRYITINFPTYNAVDNLFVGVKEGSYLGEGAPYRNIRPMVFYGGSHVQGADASRPGNTYEAMLGRFFNIDHVNLGFSDGARGEDAMADYIASLDPSVVVMEHDYNHVTLESLRDRHWKFYHRIRQQRPDLPIIMASRLDFFHINQYCDNVSEQQTAYRRQVVIDTYHRALAEGDHNVWFVDGSTILRGPFADCATVDGCHPNDLGFAMEAEVYIDLLRRLIRDEKIK